MQPKQTKKVLIIGRSGSGKTSLILKLLPVLKRNGLKVGSIKHTHHKVEFDKPGKDSYRHLEAGGERVLVVAPGKFALFGAKEPESLDACLEEHFQGFDLVVSEGFKTEPGLKIEVFRQSLGKKPLYPDLENGIKALITDNDLETQLPSFGFDQIEAISDWILQQLGLGGQKI